MVGVGTICALFVLGTLMVVDPTVDARVQLPIITRGGLLALMTVEVENKGDQPLTPRFAVQHAATTQNPIPWRIEKGPDVLHPGERGMYQIAPIESGTVSHMVDVAQVVVTDAQGRYEQRSTAVIPNDPTAQWADAITNPAYLFWEVGQSTPLFWGLRVSDGNAYAALVDHVGKTALQLTLEPHNAEQGWVSMYNWSIFPSNTLSIPLYYQAPATGSIEYGLEFSDDTRSLRILFQPDPPPNVILENDATIYRFIEPNTWTTYTIDVAALYQEVGWELPQVRRVAYRELNIDLRTIDVALYFAANGVGEEISAVFGAIQQDYYVPPRTLMAEALDDPTRYFVRLGDLYMQDNNFEQATEAYRKALNYSPYDAQVADKLAQAQAQHEQTGETR
jgi:hypothetical protein